MAEGVLDSARGLRAELDMSSLYREWRWIALAPTLIYATS